MRFSLWLLACCLVMSHVGWTQEEEQPAPTLIQWYKHFSERKPAGSLEDLLANNENKLLAATEVQDHVEEARLFLENGLLHQALASDYEKAIDLFTQALVVHDSINLQEGRIVDYLAIARVFEDVGNYFKSQQLLEQAYAFNATLKNAEAQVLILHALGRIHAALGKTEEAFANYDDVLPYSEQLGDQAIEADALFSRGSLHVTQGDYEKALQDLKRVLAIRRTLRDRAAEAITLHVIGDVYRYLKNDDRALANYVAAVEIFQERNDKAGMAAAYTSAGVLYYSQKNYQRAISNLELGLAAGRESQDKHVIRRSVEYLSNAYKALGDFKKALAYNEELVLIDDFIQNERSERQLLESQNRYVIDQKESQIGKLDNVRRQREQELAEQKKFRNLLLGGLAISAVIAALILYLYLAKRKANRDLQAAKVLVEQQNQELQKLNATKDKFFSILGHDLKGPLNSLTSFSHLLIHYFDSLSKEEIQTLANDLDKSLKNLFALLDNLLEWARSQTGAISFTPESFDMQEILKQNQELLQLQAENKKITIAVQSSHAVPVRAHRHSITTVVRNLAANAIKFTPEGGTITLYAMRDQKETVVSVTDTGVGMSPAVMEKLFRLDSKHSSLGTANEKGTGLGLILCKDFIEKNGGRIWVESAQGKGSTFYFTIPN